jgi:hypothetical protein
MGIFGTKQAKRNSQGDLDKMVSAYFKRRNFNVEDHVLPESQGTGWWIVEGSAKVYIFVQEGDRGFVVRVNAPVCQFPSENREKFFHTLLEINLNLSVCCIAVVDELVLVSAQRPILGLDQEELNDMIWNVSAAADVLDDQLVSGFGARPYAGAEA